MSEGGQRGTGDDHVLSFFFDFIIPYGEMRGETQQRLAGRTSVDCNGFEFLSWMS